MTLRRYAFLAALCLTLVGTTACTTQLKKRVTTLEAITAIHSSQLDGIFGAQAQSAKGVPLPNNWYTLVTLDVPAGSYVASGQVHLRSVSGQPLSQGFGCRLWAKYDARSNVAIGDGQGSLLGISEEVNPIGFVTLASPATLDLHCRTDYVDTVFVDFAKIVVTGVPKGMPEKVPASAKAIGSNGK